MKKIFSIILSMVLVIGILAGCAAAKTMLEGNLEDILKSMNDEVEVGMVFQKTLIKEESKYYTGLSESEFETYIESAAASEGVNSRAHLVVLLKAKDKKSAAEVQQLIYDNVDPARWICAVAERVSVGISDEYVLLIMSDEDLSKELYAEFEKLAVNVGTPLKKAGER